MPMTPIAASKQLISRPNNIPKGVWIAYKGVNSVHRIWRRMRFYSLYTNKNNFLKLGAGHLVDMAFGDKLIVRLAGQTLLVATSLIECIKTVENLSSACLNLKMHIKGDFDPLEPALQVPLKHGLIRRSLKKTKLYLLAQKEKTARIAKAFFEVVKQLFLLSMKTLDVVEALSFNPEVQRQGVRHIFINGSKVIGKLTENKEQLKEKLIANKPLIAKILKTVHAEKNTDAFIEALTKNVELTGKSVKKGQAILNSGKAVVNFLKNAPRSAKIALSKKNFAGHPKVVKQDFIPLEFISL